MLVPPPAPTETRTRDATAAASIVGLAAEAVATASSYAAASPTDADGPDLSSVLDQLESTTDAMTDAWRDYHTGTRCPSGGETSDRRREDAAFRGAYMEMATGAFAAELDEMRHGGGRDGSGRGNGGESGCSGTGGSGSGMTPHQRRCRLLFGDR